MSEEEWSPAQRLEQRFIELTAELLKLPKFRRWAMHFMDDLAWCNAGGVGADFENVNHTFHKLGRKSIGVQLRVLLQRVDARLFMQMLNEALNERAHLAVSQSKETS